LARLQTNGSINWVSASRPVAAVILAVEGG
jgi:hypothetical protein